MNLLFDLDGTITDPFEGITNSIKHSLKKLGQPIPDDLSWCIGPPLKSSFEQLLSGTSHSAEMGVDIYREYYTDKGIYQNSVIPEIENILRQLKDKGFTQFVATSKPQIYAQQILVYYGLDKYFQEIYGSELDGVRAVKSDLIAYIVKKEGLNKDKTVMIGDRKFDLDGAHKNDILSIGVRWGYGSREELENETPAAIVETPKELYQWIVEFFLGETI